MEYRDLILDYMKRVEREMVAIKEETEKQLDDIQQQKAYIMNERDNKLDAVRYTMDTLSAILSDRHTMDTLSVILSEMKKGSIPRLTKVNNMYTAEYREYIKRITKYHELGQV